MRKPTCHPLDTSQEDHDSPSTMIPTSTEAMADLNNQGATAESAEKARIKQEQALKLKYDNMKTLIDQVDGLAVTSS